MEIRTRKFKKSEREKQLFTKGKRLKVVRFLISPNKKKVKIEVNKIMKTVIRPPHVGSCHQRNRRAVLILREDNE